MSEIDDESHAKAREEIAKLRSENSELIEEMLVYTGLPGQPTRWRAPRPERISN